MKQSLREQIEALRDTTAAELREAYQEAFGEPTTSKHKDFLRRRIAWRLQANEYGGLSEHALRRAEELARDSDLRLIAPRTAAERPTQTRRIPLPGTVITREYKGRTIAVTVLDAGFEHDGAIYKSLSAVAKAVTGTHWNGFHFFRDAIGGRPR